MSGGAGEGGARPFTAIILAADREARNPVAAAAGVPCKALAPVAGTPMVARVLAALAASGEVDRQILCGPPRAIVETRPELRQALAAHSADWRDTEATPSLSAFHAMAGLEATTPVLLTTADHALLSPRVVRHFCREARAAGRDVAAGVARRETVLAAYPGTRRTAYRFRDGSFCSCNLFAFLTPAARQVPMFWRRVEAERKHPLRVVRLLGWTTVLRYLLGGLALDQALALLSTRVGCTAGAVVLPWAEAAVDVDTVADWRDAERIAAGHGDRA